MLDSSTLLIYSGACLLMLAAPGPAVLYIIARSIEHGKLAGMVSALGLSLGMLVHVFAAAFGVSAILTTSLIAFNIVKFAGAGYLIYLGVKKWRERNNAPNDTVACPRASYWRIFSQAVVVNLLNPKAALFIFAFVPQFVDPAAGSVAGQIIILGLILILLGIFSDAVYAVLAGSVGAWLNSKPTFVRLQQRFVAGVYIALGLLAAFASPSKK